MRRAPSRWVPVALVVAVALLALVSVPAHAPTPAATVVSSLAVPAPASSSATVAVAPAFRPGPGVDALGPVSAQTPLGVAVGLASRDPAGLAAWVAAAATSGTPVYRQFLSPAEAAQRFGATPASIGAAERYFEERGLTVSSSPDGLLLYVQGPSTSVAKAFGTTFEQYRLGSGRVVMSHPTTATLPSVAPWTGVLGLGNVTPIEPAAAPTGNPRYPIPAAGCGALAGYLAPCEIQQAYDFTPLLTGGTNGSGFRIGVVDAYSGDEPESQLRTDLSTFTTQTALLVGNVSYLYPVPSNVSLNSSSTNPGWSYEDALDLEWARASAPGASIDMTLAPNAGPGLYAAVDWLVGHGAVDVISMSWGEPDLGVYNSFSTPCPAACNASTDGSYAILGPVLELGAAEGITVFAASGDCGADDGTSGFTTNFPASDPFVTGVGGTNLVLAPNGSYASESGWSGNENGSTAPGCQNNGGSGGGFAPFPRPWWQIGLATVPAGRGVPDVALDAANPVAVAYHGGVVGVRGTSVATPIWAGIAALADQVAAQDLGLLNPILYRIAAGAGYAHDFHDVTTGNNGYPAGPGWDPVTGLGTPIVAALLPTLAGEKEFPSGLSAQLFASPRFGPAPLTVSFALEATGGTGSFPLEGIYFGDGNASTVVSGIVTHQFPKVGVYPAQAYAVDSSGNTTVSPPIAVVVGGGGPLTVRLTLTNATPAVGAPVGFAVNVSGGTAPYLYDYAFGDGSYATNATTSYVNHSFPAAGGFCAEVVAWDNSSSPNGAASPRVPVSVGGASAPSCGNPTSPLTLTPVAGLAARDAPADFPALFTVTGGTTPPPGLSPTVVFSASNGVTNATYATACTCALFPSPGAYTVNESMIDTVTGEANASTSLTVDPALRAAFSASTLSGPAPLTVSFSVTATGGTGANVSQTSWTFGTGAPATGATASFTYSLPGEYLAEGSLSDSGFGNASEAFLVDVGPSSGPTPLGVSATILPASHVASGQTLKFSATLIGPSNETSQDTLAWQLGQGRSAFGTDVNETYFVPAGGPGNDTLDLAVTVDGPYLVPALRVPFALASFFATEAAAFVPEADALALSSSVSPAVGLVPFSLHGSSHASGPGGTTVQWSFGDGNTSAGANVTEVYTAAGAYTVAAIATDPWGDGATERAAVIGNGLLTIAGGPATTSGTAPLSIDFSVRVLGGAGPPYSYTWKVGSETVSNGSNASLTFSEAGQYVVNLTVRDRANESVSRSWTIVARAAVAVPPLVVILSGLGVGAVLAAASFAVGRRPRPTPLSPSPLRGAPGGPPYG